jgi:hypothetical protein
MIALKPQSLCCVQTSYAASVASSIGSTIEGSSFSGLLTRAEIGHIRIKSDGSFPRRVLHALHVVLQQILQQFMQQPERAMAEAVAYGDA